MGIHLNRLKKLVRQADERQREQNDAHAKHMAMVTGALLAHSPGLRLVEPCDTDTDTYAEIQEMIAEAELRTADAKRWRAQINDPTHPSHPDYKPFTGTPEDFVRLMNAEQPAFLERCERQTQAVEAAEKRCGVTLEHPYEPPPEPLD